MLTSRNQNLNTILGYFILNLKDNNCVVHMTDTYQGKYYVV